MGNAFLFILMWAMTLILLLAVYKLCFSGTTLHRFNRCYLLGATVLSAIIPLTNLGVPQTVVVPIHETYFAQTLQEVTIYGNAANTAETAQATSEFHWAWLLVGCWAVYVIVLITGWTRSIIKTRRFLKGKTVHRLGHIRVVSHDEQFGPFSWMNYIVISNAENGFARRASIRHEISHIRLGHYADLVFLLACTIVNPVCWLIMKEIKIVHEYEADDEVINRYGIVEKDYQRLLIMRTVGAEAYALASSFNLNIKQRIIMMKKEKTMKRRMLYLLAVVPVIGLMSLLCANNANAAGLQSQEAVEQQPAPKAGDIISGTVTDEEGPMAMASVNEVDFEDRIYASALTDKDGKFSFKLAGEGHFLKIAYVGYEEVKEPIHASNMDIKLINSENVIMIYIDEVIAYQFPESKTSKSPVKISNVQELGKVISERKVRKARIAIGEKEKMETLSAVKDILRETNCLNIVYQSVLGTPLYDEILRAMGQEPEKDSEGYAMVNGRRVTKVLVNGQEEVPADLMDEILQKMTEEQKETEESISNDEPLMLVENMPEFPGGSMAMLQYLSGNIKYPEEARDNNIQGRVIISFIIEKDGSIINAEVVKSVHELLDSEALRCVTAMPAWTPGTHQGQPVRVRYTIPINFKLNDSDSDFKSVRVSYMKEMNVALFKSCKTPANAAMTVTWENLDNAIDDVINGRREFFEMDYSYYSSIQNALGNHGIDRIKYSADK